jgi:hypothetical protein
MRSFIARSTFGLPGMPVTQVASLLVGFLP